ncbi:MAG: TrkH family potassium uptake protein [Archaeoglobaceae archaeon]
MNYNYIFATNGRVLVPFSFAFLLPLTISLFEGESLLPFLVAFSSTFTMGLIFILASRKREPEISTEKDAYISVAIIWLLIPIFGSIPFLFYSIDPLNAFFESMSGFTTTGMSVLTPELLPASILFWRSFIQWLGGFGVVVLTLIFLPSMRKKSLLFYAEYPTIVLPKVKPRIRDVAMVIFQLYLVLTILEILALYFFGLDLFNALNHALTTISTGGFSTSSESIAKFKDARIEAVIAFFGFIGGLNFALIYALTNKQLRSLADLELRVYTALIAAATLILTIVNIPNYGDTLQSLRFSAFQAISFTAMGFTTANVNEWSSSAKMVLLVLMLVGGCSGSTAGGLKVIRFVILLKYVVMEIYKLMEPRTVKSIKYGSYVLEKENVEEIVAFFILYIFIFFLSSLILTLMGYDLETSLSFSASSLGNIGPVFGAPSFSELSYFAKLVLIVNMWVGRLEIIPVFMFLLSLAQKEKW